MFEQKNCETFIEKIKNKRIWIKHCNFRLMLKETDTLVTYSLYNKYLHIQKGVITHTNKQLNIQVRISFYSNTSNIIK